MASTTPRTEAPVISAILNRNVKTVFTAGSVVPASALGDVAAFILDTLNNGEDIGIEFEDGSWLANRDGVWTRD